MLSKISSVRIKLLAAQVANEISGTPIDYVKVEKLTADSGFDTTDVKAIIAAIHFVLVNSSKYDADDQVVATELQQLGLPKEHSESLCRAYRDKRALLRSHLAAKTVSFPRLTDVAWRVDLALASSELDSVAEPVVQMRTKLDSSLTGATPQDVAFEVSAEKFRMLLADLKEARDIMESAS